MTTRIVSELVPELNYNFLFEEDNKLDTRDVNIETDLHEIDIFGNIYHIAMGELKTHPNKDTLVYFIAYLIYDSKVVSKLGIYEMNKRDDTLHHKSMNYSKYTLLVDQYFYKNPDSLLPFKVEEVKESVVVPSAINEEPVVAVAAEEEPPVEVAEEPLVEASAAEEPPVEAAEELPVEASAAEVEEASSTTSLLFDFLKKEMSTLSKKPSVSGAYNVITQLRTFDDELSKDKDSEYKNLIKIEDNNKAVYDPTFFDTPHKITKSLLIAFEYILNVKFICLYNDKINSFSLLDTLTTEKLDKYALKTDGRVLQKNPSFKKYDPTRIILVKKIENTNSYEFVQEINIKEDKTYMSDIKIVFETKPHEHLIKSSLTKLKTLKQQFQTL